MYCQLCGFLLFFGTACAAADGEATVRIGIVDPTIGGIDDAQSRMAIHHELKSRLGEVGFYEVFTQKQMENELKTIHQSMPARCDDPRCAVSLGKTLRLDRVLYGSVDKTRESYGVRLTLVDVAAARIIATASLTGEPGTASGDLLAAAVAQLHGRKESELGMKTREYFGPEIDNLNELYWSSALCMGAGALWAIVNSTMLGRDDDQQSLRHIDYGAKGSDDANLSGDVASAAHVPLFARPAALANAYVAASDDACGALYNPAGSAWIPGRQATAGYQYRFGLLDHAAVSYVNKATREIGFGHAFLYSGDRERLMTETFFISGVSYKFNELVPFARPFSLGINAKLISTSTGGESNCAIHSHALGIGFDLGLIWEIADPIRFGMLFRDLPAMARWDNTTTEESYLEMRPGTFLMGGTYEVGYTTFLICEGQVPLYEEQAWKFSGGIEQELFGVLLVRAGMQKEADFNTPWKITFGGGIRANTESYWGRIATIDVAYEYSTVRVLDVFDLSFRVQF